MRFFHGLFAYFVFSTLTEVTIETKIQLGLILFINEKFSAKIYENFKTLCYYFISPLFGIRFNENKNRMT